jgi:hypothetical protein
MVMDGNVLDCAFHFPFSGVRRRKEVSVGKDGEKRGG